MSRVIAYIDGFNLYFGLKSKGWKRHYWLDVVGLSRSLLKPGQTLQAAHYFTARIRLTGFLSHDQALALQRSADVLVNIANDDPVQLPGKLFEYLGAGRPILHVGGARGLEFLLCEGRRGIAVANDVAEIGRALDRLAAIKRADAWHHEFDLDAGRFAGYE